MILTQKHAIGIDLGTNCVRLFVSGKGIVKREPTVVALDVRAGTVKSAGRDARDILGKAPSSIVAVQPVKGGVIADYDMAVALLREMLAPYRRGNGAAIISVPTGITDVERRAVREAVQDAGVAKVYLIAEPIAAAIGAKLPVNRPRANMVIHIGGGRTQVAVLTMGAVVASETVRLGGLDLDEAIVDDLKARYNLLVGGKTAEEIKKQIGSAYPTGMMDISQVQGRNLANGLPETVSVTSKEVMDALAAPMVRILDAVKGTLSRLSPDLAGDLLQYGAVLTGGTALLSGLPELISQVTGFPVRVALSPEDCVANGIGFVSEHFRALRQVLSQEEDRIR